MIPQLAFQAVSQKYLEGLELATKLDTAPVSCFKSGQLFPFRLIVPCTEARLLYGSNCNTMLARDPLII